MKANRIIFDRLKQQYEIMKMKSAYILAERDIVQDPSLTAWQETKYVAPEEVQFVLDDFGGVKNMTLKEIQIQKLEEDLEKLKKLGNELLADEKYELMVEAQELYDIALKQLNKLRGNT